ncbi:MAG TPA: choline kinase family protein [Candidatus Paceibacterota bacterium]|nr:choline kinase family protein [Candidatus Paceibacterota bacterium]
MSDSTTYFEESDEEMLEETYGSLLDQVSFLANRDSLSELSGGLTNRNLLVQNGDNQYVARISSNSSALLSIDRESEYQNSKIAASVGIAAPVLDYLPGKGLLVIGYLSGRTYSATDVAANLSRIAQSCRMLHSGPAFVRDFNMFDIQRTYLGIVQERGFRLPAYYLDFADRALQIQKAIRILDEGTVPCNNDLLPGNFIDDGEKIWIIDYEYSGNNDACFELGNIWAEAFLDVEQLEELVTAYYGESRPEKFARAWLHALMAKYGWTLWASIQSSISELDFDFWSWGMEKYDLAQSEFSGEMFTKMLKQVSEK